MSVLFLVGVEEVLLTGWLVGHWPFTSRPPTEVKKILTTKLSINPHPPPPSPPPSTSDATAKRYKPHQRLHPVAVSWELRQQLWLLPLLWKTADDDPRYPPPPSLLVWRLQMMTPASPLLPPCLCPGRGAWAPEPGSHLLGLEGKDLDGLVLGDRSVPK